MYKVLFVMLTLLSTHLAATVNDYAVDLAIEAGCHSKKCCPKGPTGPTGPAGPSSSPTGATGETGLSGSLSGGFPSYVSASVEASSQIVANNAPILYDTVNAIHRIVYANGSFFIPPEPIVPAGGADFLVQYGVDHLTVTGLPGQFSIVRVGDGTIVGSGGSIGTNGSGIVPIAFTNSFIFHANPEEELQVILTEGTSATLTPVGNAPAAFITILQLTPSAE